MAHKALCAGVWGHNFDLEELRQMTGLLPSTQPAARAVNTPRNIVLADHNFKSDFDAVKNEAGFDLVNQNVVNMMGVLDTQRLAEAEGIRVPALRKLVKKYDLHPMQEARAWNKDRQDDFVHFHNAGNEAIKTLEWALAFGHDYDTPSRSGYLDPEETPEEMPNPYPFQHNFILVTMDLDHQDSHTRMMTELGIAWHSLSDV